MDVRDLLLVAVRWSHAAAAAALVGGSLFAFVVAAPVLRERAELLAALDGGFKELLDLTLLILLVSGGVMLFDRLSSGAANTLYAVLMAAKLLLSALLFRWGYQVRRGQGWQSREAKLLVGSGLAVLLLAAALKSVFEAGLRV